MMSIESIVWASGNGYTEVNFMEGEELYKSIFATGKRGICDFLVGRTFRGKAHKALFTALTLYREAKRKWQAKRSQKKG
jgi:CelD/BcsL family acetyltransferase involved in cellulose biosynthesis